MDLTIDANILVSELDRNTGASQSLLGHPTLGMIYIAKYTWDEAIYVLERKVAGWIRGGRLTQDIAAEVLRGTISIFASRCAVITESAYAIYENEARRTPGDPDDWHTVALAMATEIAIWTLDQKHFFGCGMAVWKTSVLRAMLIAEEQQ